MNAKRKKCTEWLLEFVAKVVPGDTSNVDLLKADLEKLTDAEFEDWVRRVGPAKTPEELANRIFIPIIVPNLRGPRVSIANNYKLARELGRSLEHRLIMVDGATGLEYVTPHFYPVYDLPVRRQAQTQAKKGSIPSHNQRTDDLTDQPTSMSKGSRMSSVELASLLGRRLDYTVLETAGTRGGNSVAYREFKRQLIDTGSASLESLEGLGNNKSTESLAIYFNCICLGNNLLPSTPVPEDAKPDSLRRS